MHWGLLSSRASPVTKYLSNQALLSFFLWYQSVFFKCIKSTVHFFYYISVGLQILRVVFIESNTMQTKYPWQAMWCMTPDTVVPRDKQRVLIRELFINGVGKELSQVLLTFLNEITLRKWKYRTFKHIKPYKTKNTYETSFLLLSAVICMYASAFVKYNNMENALSFNNFFFLGIQFKYKMTHLCLKTTKAQYSDRKQ